MTQQRTHIDAVNGAELRITLHAPYQTLPRGSAYARGKAAKNFCRENNSEYCLIVDNQIWAGEEDGVLLFALVDQQIPQLSIFGSTTILLPLDRSVYCVEVGDFGACVPNSEEILTVEQALSKTQRGGEYVVIDGGALTQHFATTETLLLDFKHYQLKSIERELFAKRLFTPLHYGLVSAMAVSVAAAAFVLPSMLSNLTEEAPVIAPVVMTPRATDLAVNQLLYIDQALDEISYFLGRGLYSLTYDTGAGLTLLGNYRHSEVMAELAADSGKANLSLVFNGNGWTVNQQPAINVRPLFDLNGFNENLLRIQKIAETYDLNTSIDAPRADLERRTILVQLSSNNSLRPPLEQIAHSLEGVAATVQSVEIGFDEYEFAFYRINLNVSGRL